MKENFLGLQKGILLKDDFFATQQIHIFAAKLI